MARRTWTDATVANLKPKGTRYALPDPALPGHYVRVQPSGTKAYCAVARDLRGKQIWHTIGSPNVFSLEDAREAARKSIKAIKAGEDHQPPDSFEAVAAEWMKRHVDAKGLRSKHEIKRHVARMEQAWSGRDFASLRRPDVAKLLDRIEDKHGTRQADYALAVIRGMANWYARRHENYVSPVVKGMNRQSTKETARDRTLTDDELRALWNATESEGTFGAIVRVLLLTGQRLEKVATMRWQDLDDQGVWTIPTAPREKGNAGELVLPQIVREVIAAQPSFLSNPYVFPGRGKQHFKSGAHGKRTIDSKLKFEKPWRLHDLRRTARSFMARAGVRPDIAERVVGHAILGVEGVYDRHKYRDEKAHALNALADLVDTIVKPRGPNIIKLTAAQ
jgi:integrase